MADDVRNTQGIESDKRPGSTTSHKPDAVVFPEARAGDEVLETDLTEQMVRRPVESDFDEVLTPEGDSGHISGSDVSDSTIASNASIAGTE